MSEEQGQAIEQPTVEQQAEAIAERIVDPEPKKKPAETQAAEEAPETEAQEEVEEKDEGSIELDLDAKLFDVEETLEGGKKESKKYSLNELKAQRMMQADYQRKTAELARQREALSEQIKQQTEPVIKQYQENLQVLETAVWQKIAPSMQNTDWNKLAQENPGEWARKMQEVSEGKALLDSIQSERVKLNESAAKEQHNQKQQQIQKAIEVLQTDIPGWGDELYTKVRKAGVGFGYTMEELNQAIDPRAIKVLHAAMKYQELQTAKPLVEKKVVNVPKVVKPGSTEKTDPNRDTLNKAKAQLKKTGRKEDELAYARLLVGE